MQPVLSSEQQALQRHPWAQCSPDAVSTVVLRPLDNILTALNNGIIWQPFQLQTSCLNVNTFDRSTFQVHPETKGLESFFFPPKHLELNHICCTEAFCLSSFGEMKSWFAELDS